MKKRILIAFLVVVIGFSFESTNSMDIENEIERRLKLLNKPAVKSIESEDGDIIDCVDIYNQPAFDHPAFKNHTIQIKPPSYMTRDASIKNRHRDNVFASQTWRKSGSCLKGTIPIRRVRREDLLRAFSLENFGRKNQYVYNKTYHHFKNVNGSKLPGVPNRAAAFLFSSSYNFIYAQGEINVWNPSIDLPDDYSSSQIWLKHGGEFIESGWIVNPKLYGDKETRFFGSWTVDMHQSTGCFDLTCPGFVQIDKDIALGASISKVEVKEGMMSFLGISFVLENSTGNWWLYTNGKPIGYWPKSLFKKLYYSANIIQWGGEVYSTNLYRSPHTKTHMGSGQLGEEEFDAASFIQYMKVKDFSLTLKDPPLPQVYADEIECYNAVYETSYDRPYLLYGGPGGEGYRCYRQ